MAGECSVTPSLRHSAFRVPHEKGSGRGRWVRTWQLSQMQGRGCHYGSPGNHGYVFFCGCIVTVAYTRTLACVSQTEVGKMDYPVPRHTPHATRHTPHAVVLAFALAFVCLRCQHGDAGVVMTEQFYFRFGWSWNDGHISPVRGFATYHLLSYPPKVAADSQIPRSLCLCDVSSLDTAHVTCTPKYLAPCFVCLSCPRTPCVMSVLLGRCAVGTVVCCAW